MRDDTSDSALPRSADHIWLRQSVTFAVNGQTRTLELALPLRPGATPDEVESLLDEAEAGMRRLSRRLDAHLAEITRAAQPADTPTVAPAPTPVAPAPTPHRAPAPAPQPVAAAPRATPAPASAERPAPPAAASATQAGPDLSRAEFLAAIASELGLDAKAVMERLNVRSLTGLNLRETLDLLRRQVAREGGEGGAPSQPAPATASKQEPEQEPEPLPAPIGRARFDEEDDDPDFEISSPDPHDLPGEDDYDGDEDFAPQEVAPAPIASARGARSDAPRAAGPLSDVPDLDDLLSETSAASAATPAVTPAPDSAEARTRALIATLRAAHAGGQPTEHQRTAHKNIVIGQLGEDKAARIARALWNLTTSGQLGPEQFDALIRWGKEDAFAEEVEQVLELLRADYRAQQAQQEQATQQPAVADTAPAQRPAAQRAATRARAAAEQPTEAPAPARPTPRGRSSANGGPARGAGPQGGA